MQARRWLSLEPHHTGMPTLDLERPDYCFNHLIHGALLLQPTLTEADADNFRPAQESDSEFIMEVSSTSRAECLA